MGREQFLEKIITKCEQDIELYNDTPIVPATAQDALQCVSPAIMERRKFRADVAAYMLDIFKAVLVVAVLWIAGCQQLSHILIRSGDDPNSIMEYNGEAANIIAQQQAENSKTKAAYLSDMFKFNAIIWSALAIMTIAGVAFWILTGSSKGWIIPLAGVVGMGLMYGFIEYGRWFALAVMAVGVGVLVWKAYQYQSERNTALKGVIK